METRITASIITTTITTTSTTTSVITTSTSVADLTITVTGQVLSHALHASHRRTEGEMLLAQARSAAPALPAAPDASAMPAAPAADAATPASDLATSTLLGPPATDPAAKHDKAWDWYWDYDESAWAKYSIHESDSGDDDYDESEPKAQNVRWWDAACDDDQPTRRNCQPKRRPTPPNTPPPKKARCALGGSTGSQDGAPRH
jgi:hypothetical protein